MPVTSENAAFPLQWVVMKMTYCGKIRKKRTTMKVTKMKNSVMTKLAKASFFELKEMEGEQWLLKWIKHLFGNWKTLTSVFVCSCNSFQYMPIYFFLSKKSHFTRVACIWGLSVFRSIWRLLRSKSHYVQCCLLLVNVFTTAASQLLCRFYYKHPCLGVCWIPYFHFFRLRIYLFSFSPRSQLMTVR